jgi:MarR family transcriptional regulator, organic hydroperoxide resistance regulator
VGPCSNWKHHSPVRCRPQLLKQLEPRTYQGAHRVFGVSGAFVRASCRFTSPVAEHLSADRSPKKKRNGFECGISYFVKLNLGTMMPAKPAAFRQRKLDRAPLTISRPELLSGGSDRDFRRLVDLIFAFAARVETIRNGHAKRIGLSGPEYTMLVALRHLQDDGEVSIKLLADYFHVSGSFVTTTVGRLLRAGLVEKHPDPIDRRRLRLQVARKGHDLLAILAPIQRQVNDVAYNCLSVSDFRSLLDVLARLTESSNHAIALQKYFAQDQSYKSSSGRRRASRRAASDR